ncbi:hypothetical protein HDU93_005683, partial [Gonapodya sp. JEL0774]
MSELLNANPTIYTQAQPSSARRAPRVFSGKSQVRKPRGIMHGEPTDGDEMDLDGADSGVEVEEIDAEEIY